MCELRHGGGGLSIATLLCDLPTNHLLQCTFSVLWIWMAAMEVLSLLSLIYVLYMWKWNTPKEIDVNFGNWILMWFVSFNLNDTQYILFLEHVKNGNGRATTV